MAINIIEYITKNKGLKQQDIAEKLGVTTGQISKWKKGEYISADRRRELNKLGDLFSDNLDWTLISKTKENADAWFAYINWYSDEYNREIEDEGDFFIPYIFTCLSDLGAKIPDKAPSVSEMDSDNYELTSFDSVITDLLYSYAILVQWNDKIISERDFDDLWDYFCEIASNALNVAMINVSMVGKSNLLAIGIKENILDQYINKSKKNIRRCIKNLLLQFNEKGLPITKDYYLIIDQDTEWLDDEMMFSSNRNNILEHLSYADRNLLETQKYGIELLESLNRKVDTLLSEENKKKLRDDPDVLMEDS